MPDLSYVRTDVLPERAPPTSQSGAIKWVRENLFDGWFNGIMTLVSVYVIYSVLSHILPWMFNGVWVADSLQDCRVVLEAAIGSTDGACWAVLTERWKQLLYGFYPSEFYWRANLAFLLLFFAVAPILYDNLPRKMLWFTAVYPFLMVWLVWGGSVWGPLAAMAGFMLAIPALQLGSKFSSLVGTVAAFAVPVIWWLFLAGPIANGLDGVLPIGIQAVQSKLLGGFLISVVIGLSGIALSLPIGVVLALGRQSDLFVVKILCVGFIEFIRGVPLITLLFTASLLLNYFLPKGTNFDLVLRVIIMVTIFSAAYMAETIRGGLAALPKGQYEGADSLGLDYWQAQRLIIMPQALKISIPGIVGNFIGLFKDTTLVLFIGIFDMLGIAGAVRATTEWNGIYWELFIFIALVFWVCCFSMSRYSQWLERKLQTEHR